MKKYNLVFIFVITICSWIFADGGTFTGRVYMIDARENCIAVYFVDYSNVSVPWGVEVRVHPVDGNKSVQGTWIAAPQHPEQLNMIGRKNMLANLLLAKQNNSTVRVVHDSEGIIQQIECFN